MRENENSLCFLLFAFGFIMALFHITPALLPDIFKWPLTWGDALDFLTPFAVIPAAFIIYARTDKILHSPERKSLSNRAQKVSAKVLLAIGFLLYVDGHGLHLSSNSISRLLLNMEESKLYKAAYLFDEIISHFMWDGGLFLISVSLILLASKLSIKSLSRGNIFLLSAGAIFYGFTFTLNGIEGQTVLFSFPGAGAGFLLALLFYLKRHRQGGQNPHLLFFMSAYFMSFVLFSYWGISHSGFFPQFSELGWI